MSIRVERPLRLKDRCLQRTLTARFNIIGNLSSTSQFTIGGYQTTYSLQANGTLQFSDAGISITYQNQSNVDSSGNMNTMYLDSSNYEIQQYNCDRPGEGQLIFVGKNYCIGSQTIPIRVVGDLKNVEVINVNDQYDYTGKQIKPTPIVQFGSQVLEEGEDYTIEYGNNVDVGTNSGRDCDPPGFRYRYLLYRLQDSTF